MAKRIIEISVNDEYVVGAGIVIGAAGSHNDVVMRVRFNQSWVGLNIIAIFRDAKGENPTSVVLTSAKTLKESESDYEIHEFSVPLNVKKYEGKATLAFLGYTIVPTVGSDGEPVYKEEAVISSGTAYFNVLQSDVILADEIFKEANAGQQLHDDANRLGKMCGDLEENLQVIKALQEALPEIVMSEFEGEEVKLFPLLDLIYPIGTVYLSVNPANPETLFGGKWESGILSSNSDVYSWKRTE